MINFSDFFNKKFLITLFGLFFISLVTLDPLFHDHYAIEDEHSELECNFCINDLFDDNIDIPLEKLFLSDLNNFKNLDNYTPQFFINFYSRAPPKI